MSGPDWGLLERSFRAQRDFCQGYSPLYFALYEGLLQAVVQRDDPAPAAVPFLELLARLAPKRAWNYAMEPALVVGAAIHAVVLQRAPGTEALQWLYPSVEGSFTPEDTAELQEEIFRFLATPRPGFEELLETLLIQTNEVTRGVAWLLPALLLLKGPIQLVDLGCSAGLNLFADALGWRWLLDDGAVEWGSGESIEQQVVGGAAFSPRPLQIVKRLGVDRAPREVTTPRDRLLLRACIFPDHLERLRRFDRAADRYLAAKGEVSLLRADLVAAPRAVEPLLDPSPSTVIVYSTVATAYLSAGDREALGAELVGLFGRLGGRKGLWLEMEPARDLPAGPLHLVARLLVEGRPEEIALWSCEAHPRRLQLVPGGLARLGALLSA